MRKTHGKKQTRKNKTKKRAIRGGGKHGLGTRHIDWYDRKTVFGNQASAQNRGNTEYIKAHKVGNHTVSKSKSKRPLTRSQTSKSTAPKSPQQNVEESY